MAIQGTLTTMSVSDLLQFLAVGKKTGTLKFMHQKVVKGIFFENGVIVGSSTNDPKEYLGQVLIHYGKLDEAQLQAAMEVQRKAGKGRLGQILITQGVLKESEIADILKIRTLDIIYDLFIWKEAHFEFIVVRRQTYQHLELQIVCFNMATDSRRRTVYLVDKTIQLMYKGLFRQWLE